MKDYEILKSQGGAQLNEIEEKLSNQESYQSLTKDEKIGLFKDYLFLSAINHQRYNSENMESLYEEIDSGIDSLDEVLTALAENVRIGADCVEELDSSFMTESILGNPGQIINNNGSRRRKYVKSIEAGDTEKFHNEYDEIQIENGANMLKKNKHELDNIIHGLERNEEKINQDMAWASRKNDLDAELKANASAGKFAEELDQINEQVNEELNEDVNQLFADNKYVQKNNKIKERNKKRFLDADKRSKEKFDPDARKKQEEEKKLKEESKKLDDLLVGLDEGADNELFPGINAENPFNGGAENPFADGPVNPFGENAGNPFDGGAENPFAEGPVNPFGGSAENPFADIPQVPGEEEKEQNKNIDELLKDINAGEAKNLGDLDSYINYQNAPGNKNKQDDAKKFEEDLKKEEQLVNEVLDPEIKEREAAFREVDRIEQIFADQKKFEEQKDKVGLAKSYLLNRAILNQNYISTLRYDLDDALNGYSLGEDIKKMLNYVKSGENVKKELQGTHLNKLFYGDVHKMKDQFMDEPDPYEDNTYLSHLQYIEKTELRDFREYGSYAGKPKDNVKEDDGLDEAFPENEINNRIKKQEADERIRQRKDAIAREKREQESIRNNRNERFEKSGKLESFKDSMTYANGIDNSNDKAKRKSMTPEEAEREMERLKAQFYDIDSYAALTPLRKQKLMRDYMYALGVKEEGVYNLSMSPGRGSTIKEENFNQQKLIALYGACYNSKKFGDDIFKLSSTVKDGRDVFKILTNTESIKMHISNAVSGEFKNTFPIFHNPNLDDLTPKIEANNKRIENEAAVRKNPKKAGKNIDNYIIIHTGAGAGKTKEEMLDNLAKVCAATKLKSEGKKLNLDEIHNTAARFKSRFPKALTYKPEFQKQMKNAMLNADYAVEFSNEMKNAMFRVSLKKFSEYQKEMKQILNNMSSPKGRSEKYLRFYNSVKAVTDIEIKSNLADYDLEKLEQSIIDANENMFDATHAYIQGKEKVRVKQYGKKSFDNALDVLSTSTKFMPGTKLSTLKIVDDINAVRKKDRPLDRNEFLKTYGAKRAAEANTKKTKTQAEKNVTKENPKMGKK